MGELFDRYVVVDWSAAGRPATGRDSIWIAVLDDDRRAGEVRLANPRTRRLAERHLVDLRCSGGRTLVAVDASLGYPAGTAVWFGLGGDEPWQAMWHHLETHVVDGDDNANNRFEAAAALNRRGEPPGPFWGRPASVAVEGLEPRKPGTFPVPEFRRVEEHLRVEGLRPASAWQLLGAGSVGSQTLTLLPVLRRLLGTGATEVWPFTTGLAAPRHGSSRGSSHRSIVLAETWPTVFELDLSAHCVRDAAQVTGVAHALRRADASGRLAEWFAPPLDTGERVSAEREEGWVLRPAFRTGPAG